MAGLIVRVIARSLAILAILILLAFMVPEDGGSFVAAWHWSSLELETFIFPLGFLLGLVLVLWKDLLGGVVSIACIVTTYVRFALAGDSLEPIVAFGVVPGVLSIMAWIFTHRYVAREPARPSKHGGV